MEMSRNVQSKNTQKPIVYRPFFACKKRREKTLNIAKLTDWTLRLDHPPWTASKGRGKQRFRRILTPLDIRLFFMLIFITA